MNDPREHTPDEEAGRTDGEALSEPASPDPPESRADRAVPAWLSRAIALAAGWVVLLFVTYWVLGRLRTLLIMVLVAFFLSLAMEPAVTSAVASTPGTYLDSTEARPPPKG